MAKFKDLHLLIQEEQRILFGDDALGVYGPDVYPAVDPGNEKAFMGWTTISGYNTTLPSSGTTSITPVDELVISVPVAGERATEDYHLVRYDQLTDFTPDHGDLTGLDGDDHLYYVPVDGSRGFTNTVSGVYPVEGYHLVTKDYVDAVVSGVSHPNHCDLNGLDEDCHLQYVPTSGTRGFTGTVSGIDPTESYHLTTRWYVDGEITTLSGIIYEELENYFNLNEDNTVSGSTTFVGPTVFEGDVIHEGDVTNSGTVTFDGPTIFNEPLTVNSGINFGDSTISGTGYIYTENIYANNHKWGRMACIDGNRNQAVTFDNPWPDDNYTVVATLTNETEATPSIYSTIQGVKAGGGFTTHFSGKIDSTYFVLEWHAFYDEFH